MADHLPVVDEMDQREFRFIDARTVSYPRSSLCLYPLYCWRSVHVPSKTPSTNCTRISQRLSMSNTSRLSSCCWPTTTPPSGFPRPTRPWRWPLPRTRHPAAVAAAAPLPSGRNTGFGCWQSQSMRNKSRCLSLIGFHAKLSSQQGSGKIWASEFTFGFGLSPV